MTTKLRFAHLAPLACAAALVAAPTPLAARQAPAAPESAALDARRAEIVATGERYASLRWRADEGHAMHGEDENGTWVDTPDATFEDGGWNTDGSENVGMPYSWGGFTSVEQFEQGLTEGLWAGNVPRSEHAGASARAMGLDCSGFVSRAWNLPQKQSTRSLGALCYELASYDELLPGDIANKFDAHVVLVLGFADEARTQLRILEAARLRVEENVYPVAALERSGFVPMRYKPLDERWVPMELGAPRFESDAAGTFEPDGRTEELAEIASPLAGAQPGDWVRYRVPSYGPAGVRVATFVARRDGGELELQSAFTVGVGGEGGELMSGGPASAGAPLADALLDFARFQEPLRDMELRESGVEHGEYTAAGKRFDAQRITLRYSGSQLVRHALYPTVVEARVVRSDAVPLLGVLEASYAIEVDWSSPERGEDVRRHEKTFELEASGS